MQKEGTNFGQLVLLHWRKQSKEDYLPSENELNEAIKFVDSAVLTEALKRLSCEKTNLIGKLFFEGIKDNPLPYHHLSVLGTFGEKYYFVVSRGRAKQIIDFQMESFNGKFKEQRFYAQKFAAQLKAGYELRDVL